MEEQTNEKWVACLRKKKYETPLEALEAAHYANVRTGHGNIQPYECPYGDHYHIGHALPTCPECGAQMSKIYMDAHRWEEHGVL